MKQSLGPAALRIIAGVRWPFSSLARHHLGSVLSPIRVVELF
jgi:hypothetical protein